MRPSIIYPMVTILACVKALGSRGGGTRRIPGIIYPARSRLLSSSQDGDKTTTSSTTTKEWRRKQLDALEKRFAESEDLVEDKIQDDEGLQDMWKSMESRVRNRRSMTVEQQTKKGTSGRTNIRKTDEDVWLQEGLYDTNIGKDKDNASK
jgi:hypothetical protein